MTPGLLLVYAVWTILLFDAHYFLGIMVASPFLKLATLIFIPLLGVIALQGPAIFTSMKSWVWYPPLALLLVASLASIPITPNLTMARSGIQTILLYYAAAVATALYVKTPRHALPIFVMFGVRFLWWAIWGRASGQIAWHPTMSNFDGFGGLMVQGAGICFWFGMAARSPRAKLLMFVLAAYCVVGVVASFARGAFLALVAVAGLIWLRSPRKALTGAGMILGAGVALAAATLLFGGDAFLKEMMTSFEEGTESGTGAHRWVLWQTAMKVWTQAPLFGVGANNFGAFAASYFRPGQIEGFEDPNRLWGLNLHSAYFQILSEFGIVGVIAFIWIMVDFVQKNRAVRQPDAIARWAAMGLAAKYDLRALSLGLEAGLAATFLANAVYASFFESWFITLWSTNRILWSITRAPNEAWPAPRAPAGRRQPRRQLE